MCVDMMLVNEDRETLTDQWDEFEKDKEALKQARERSDKQGTNWSLFGGQSSEKLQARAQKLREMRDRMKLQEAQFSEKHQSGSINC